MRLFFSWLRAVYSRLRPDHTASYRETQMDPSTAPAQPFGTSRSIQAIVLDAQGTLWIISCPSVLVDEMTRVICNGNAPIQLRPRTGLNGNSAEA